MVENRADDKNKHCSREKAEGAFIALAAGDALGWPQEIRGNHRERYTSVSVSKEFHAWTRRSGGRFYAYEEVINRGEYSDDTQLTLAVARSLSTGGSGWWTVLTRTEIPLWTVYQRGGGAALKHAAESWVRGVPPWKIKDEKKVRRYFEAGGNGAAMRVLPHAIFDAGLDDPSVLIRNVILDGIATHGHPRALIGAAAYAYAAWWLLRSVDTVRFGQVIEVLMENISVWGSFPVKEGYTKNGWLEAANRSVKIGYEHLWRQVTDEMHGLLKEIKNGLTLGAIADDEEILTNIGSFGPEKGSGVITAAASLYLFSRYAAQPVLAVLKGAFTKGADTDTIAAMTGSLMGCLSGRDWLPAEWFSVQDCEYIRNLANLVSRSTDSLTQERKFRTIFQKDVDSLIEGVSAGEKSELEFDGVRRVQVLEMITPNSLVKKSKAKSWKLKTSDGQIIYITKIGKNLETVDTPAPDVQPKIPELSFKPVTKPAGKAAGVKISAANVFGMADFYENVFGLVPIRKTSRFVSYGPVSLVDAKYAYELSSGAVDVSIGPGRNRIEIQVSNLEAAYRWVQEAKVRIVQGITRMPWGERVFHCFDPEGNIIEVAERR